MHVCCNRDLKLKVKRATAKLLPRQDGDLTMNYDILQAYGGNYLAQVFISNNNQLGRLENWNLTWEWMRGEFIYAMKGACTLSRDFSDCIYGPAAKYYQALEKQRKGDTNPAIDPPVPGKQKSVIFFKKKQRPDINTVAGDGFPWRLYFNGEECSLPTEFPIGAGHRFTVSILPLILLPIIVLVLLMDQIC